MQRSPTCIARSLQYLIALMLASCANVPDQSVLPGYFVGQVITSATPVGPGTVINHSVFFPCDGGVYQYIDRHGVQHAVGTTNYSGALVRAVSLNTPSWVGLKGVLGAVDSHVHSISSPTGSEFAYFENDFCRARAGTFEVRDVDDYNDASCYLSPIKWETPYM